MRNFGSSILESRGEGSSRLVVVVMGFLVKEGLSKESGQRGRRRDKETPAARSRRAGIFEHGRRNMLIYGGCGTVWGHLNKRVDLISGPVLGACRQYEAPVQSSLYLQT